MKLDALGHDPGPADLVNCAERHETAPSCTNPSIVIFVSFVVETLGTAPQNKVANSRSVTPAKGGFQNALKGLDSYLRPCATI
jgi:hypothetical protein